MNILDDSGGNQTNNASSGHLTLNATDGSYYQLAFSNYTTEYWSVGPYYPTSNDLQHYNANTGHNMFNLGSDDDSVRTFNNTLDDGPGAGGNLSVLGNISCVGGTVSIVDYFGNTFFNITPTSSGAGACLNLQGTGGRYWQWQGGGNPAGGAAGLTLFGWGNGPNIYSGYIQMRFFDNGNCRIGPMNQSGGFPGANGADNGNPFQVLGNATFDNNVTVAGTLAGAASKFVVGSSGTATTYNNISVVSNGLSSIVAQADLATQVAAKTATTLYTPAASGTFRVSVSLQVTRAATTSSILGGTTGVVITYTEPDGSVAQTKIIPVFDQNSNLIVTSTGNTGNLTTTQSEGEAIIRAKTGVVIQYAIGYTSVGATTMQYAAHLKLEAL